MHCDTDWRQTLRRENINFIDLDEMTSRLDEEALTGAVVVYGCGCDCPLTFELEALGKGARGVIYKDMGAQELNEAIKALNNNIRWFSRAAMSTFIDQVQKSQAEKCQLQSLLTRREREIAQLIIQGLSNKEIALEKKIAETTAKTHVQNLLRKLGVKNRTQLVGYLSDFNF
ncbi:MULTISPECIES: response regulator transcription factor [unclassified Pseudoalteromonas]|uniref:response regulator transcription factor n=1 Tax=unclassified Pseudoalteromonas TaxID=194690 RepID=UPI000CF67F41|nr:MULTISPECIES: response regulator transcription factor [unclassified Pseudoalteromonas]